MEVATCAVVVTHDPSAANGFVRAIRVSDAASLAQFAGQADSILEVGAVEPEHVLEGFLMQSFGLAERACMSVADSLTPQP
jgi:hypothetical protein